MEVLKDISQLTKGCGVTFIKNDKFHFYEYLMVHPNREKLMAINKLMDIADYYNKGWKPNWINIDEHKFFILYDNIDKIYTDGYNTTFSSNTVYFKHKEDVQAVIDNPNFREILDKIYKS